MNKNKVINLHKIKFKLFKCVLFKMRQQSYTNTYYFVNLQLHEPIEKKQ